MSQSRSISLFLPIVILFGMLFATTAITTPVSAATIVVNSLADNEINDSLCTLREAITAANTDAPYLGCPAGNGLDTITLSVGTYTLQSQLPNIASQIIINGSGAANTIIQASACNPITTPGGCTPSNYRIFRVNTGSGLRINQVTVRHGKEDLGGGIHNFGTLFVENSIISDNFAAEGGGIAMSFGLTIIAENSIISDNWVENPETGGGWGAGVSNYQGLLFVENSTIVNNTSTYFGGGIYNHQGSLSITASTLSENYAGWGGGISTSGENTVLIDSSTFSHNIANNDGGGIYIDGELLATNSTFSGNTAHTGGGIFANSGVVNLESSTISENNANFSGGVHIYGTLNFSNTLIANSINGEDCYVWTAGTGSIGTNTHNLVGDGSCSNGGTNFISGDPKLGPLANNGGPTRTHALMTDSPAIDAGNCSTADNFDQRGRPRPIGASCDIGAFEFNPALDGYKFIFLPLLIR